MEAELKVGRSEEQARDGVERRKNDLQEAAYRICPLKNRRDQPGCGWRSAWTQRAIIIAGEAPAGAS